MSGKRTHGVLKIEGGKRFYLRLFGDQKQSNKSQELKFLTKRNKYSKRQTDNSKQ